MAAGKKKTKGGGAGCDWFFFLGFFVVFLVFPKLAPPPLECELKTSIYR